MLIIKGLYYHLLSILTYYAADYNKSMYYAKRSAAGYIKCKKIFSSKKLELHIEKCTYKILKIKDLNCPNRLSENRIGILASTIYDVGGHTECLMRFSESFHSEYDLRLFLTNSNGDSRIEAKTKYSYLKTILTVSETDNVNSNFDVKINFLITEILKSEVKILFVYMHMNDVISCAILAYLSKHTDVKVVFFNHGDHTFSLGFEFSDLIIELRKQGQFITQHYRNKLNTTIIPLQGVKSDQSKVYSAEVLMAKRKDLGLSSDDLVSMSGFSNYKVFKDKKYSYLNFIKKILESEYKLKHILVTEISHKENKIINKVFRGSEHLLERLILIDRVVEFDLLLQVGDVFIDSFPLGSALVHIDAIRNKRPTIIKKNSKNELYTFYNYLYDEYEYAIENIDEMLEKTLYLIRNKDEQYRIASKCYNHYLDTYEFQTIKSKYKQIIENHQTLSKFYTPLPVGYKCTIAV
ncbi:MAG: hypothetical protein HGB32_07970 [Geobacteraceae bacterium]|nr:hypothetical protein [Geobacteraceae bacterium]